MKVLFKLVLLGVSLFLIQTSKTEAAEKLDEALQLFYEEFQPYALPLPEGYCGFGMDLIVDRHYLQLQSMQINIDEFLETVLTNQTKRGYWIYALSIYKQHYKQEPFKIQNKVFALLKRYYNFNDETVLNFYINLIGGINSTIYETSKADPVVYSYFKNDEVATIEYWQNKLTQQHKLIEPNPKIDCESYHKRHESVVTACTAMSLKIVGMLYVLSDDTDYYNIIVNARNSKNHQIRESTNHLLSKDYFKFLRERMHL